ncbi:MAG: phosphorylase, partial [Cyanobacteria bacterium J06649_11]
MNSANMEESVSQSQAKSLLEPGTLWSKTVQTTQSARQCGALKSIETEYHLIQQQEISFIVRTLSNLARKEQAGKKQRQQESKTGKKIDPFLPYEPELFVGNLSNTHLCLLNKFNVVDNHLLIVTRAFESQTDLLNLYDFKALWDCLREIDGLAFFNGGKAAGASQSHKHLQLIPLPFLPNVVHHPLESAIANTAFSNNLGQLSCFPFRHGIVRLQFDSEDSETAIAEVMLQKYCALLDFVGLKIDGDSKTQPGAYNFLATKKWMMIVPRSQESLQNISINSLGFAGS